MQRAVTAGRFSITCSLVPGALRHDVIAARRNDLIVWTMEDCGGIGKGSLNAGGARADHTATARGNNIAAALRHDVAGALRNDITAPLGHNVADPGSEQSGNGGRRLTEVTSALRDDTCAVGADDVATTLCHNIT